MHQFGAGCDDAVAAAHPQEGFNKAVKQGDGQRIINALWQDVQAEGGVQLLRALDTHNEMLGCAVLLHSFLIIPKDDGQRVEARVKRWGQCFHCASLPF